MEKLKALFVFISSRLNSADHVKNGLSNVFVFIGVVILSQLVSIYCLYNAYYKSTSPGYWVQSGYIPNYKTANTFAHAKFEEIKNIREESLKKNLEVEDLKTLTHHYNNAVTELYKNTSPGEAFYETGFIHELAIPLLLLYLSFIVWIHAHYLDDTRDRSNVRAYVEKAVNRLHSIWTYCALLYVLAAIVAAVYIAKHNMVDGPLLHSGADFEVAYTDAKNSSVDQKDKWRVALKSALDTRWYFAQTNQHWWAEGDISRAHHGSKVNPSMSIWRVLYVTPQVYNTGYSIGNFVIGAPILIILIIVFVWYLAERCIKEATPTIGAIEKCRSAVDINIWSNAVDRIEALCTAHYVPSFRLYSNLAYCILAGAVLFLAMPQEVFLPSTRGRSYVFVFVFIASLIPVWWVYFKYRRIWHALFHKFEVEIKPENLADDAKEKYDEKVEELRARLGKCSPPKLRGPFRWIFLKFALHAALPHMAVNYTSWQKLMDLAISKIFG